MGWWHIGSENDGIDWRFPKHRESKMVNAIPGLDPTDWHYNGDDPADEVAGWLAEAAVAMKAGGTAPSREVLEAAWHGRDLKGLPPGVAESLARTAGQAKAFVERLYLDQWGRPPHAEEWAAAFNFAAGGRLDEVL